MATIQAASLVQYDERTDVRHPTGRIADRAECEWLSTLLSVGEARLVPGLVGWGEMTHTLHADFCLGERTYHVRLEV